MSRITTSKRKLRQGVAGVPDQRVQLRSFRQRQLLQHEVQQFALQLHGVLHGAWPGGLDVARKRQGAGAQMERADRLAPRRGKIHHMADPAQIFIEDVPGVRQIDMGLLRPADAEHKAAVGEGIGFDRGMLAGGPEEPRRGPLLVRHAQSR
jgi:hypothetical protein